MKSTVTETEMRRENEDEMDGAFDGREGMSEVGMKMEERKREMHEEGELFCYLTQTLVNIIKKR